MKRVCFAHGLDYFGQKYTGSDALTFPDLPDLFLETSQVLTRIDAQPNSPQPSQQGHVPLRAFHLAVTFDRTSFFLKGV